MLLRPEAIYNHGGIGTPEVDALVHIPEGGDGVDGVRQFGLEGPADCAHLIEERFLDTSADVFDLGGGGWGIDFVDADYRLNCILEVGLAYTAGGCRSIAWF